MKGALVFIGGLLSLVAVAFYCVSMNTPVIQQEISSRLVETYSDQRINWAKATVDGRDITLSGEAPSEEDMRYALELAQKLDGVRVVYNRQTVMSRIITTPVTAAPDFSTSITLKDGKVVMTGHVPDEESRLLLLTLARAQFGDSAVVDNLSVAPGAPDDWRQVISAVLMNLAGFKEVAAAISPGRLMLEGVARDRQTADMVRNHVSESLPESIQPDLSIRLTEVSGANRQVMNRPEAVEPEAAPGESVEGKGETPRGSDSPYQEAGEAEMPLATAETAAVGSESGQQQVADENPVEQREPVTTAVPEIADTEASRVQEPVGATSESPTKTDSGEKRPFELLADEESQNREAGDATAETLPEPEVSVDAESVADKAVSEAVEKTWVASEGEAGKVTETAFTEAPPSWLDGPATPIVTPNKESGDLAPDTQAAESADSQPAGPAADESATETGLEPFGPPATADSQVPDPDAVESPVADETKAAEPIPFEVEEEILVDTSEDDEAEKSRCLASINAMLDGKRINFHFDSTYVHTRHNGMLDKIVAVAILCPEVIIQVEGHTDSIGPAAYNQQLSERRAASGASALNKRGIWQEQLTSIGYGETRPVASNRTKAGRAMNRRIEFKVKETQP